MRAHLTAVLATLGFFPQAGAPPELPRGDDPSKVPLKIVGWKEGVPLRIRVPVATPDRELMTVVAFPEERVETAITGWSGGGFTATAKGAYLFLKLTRKGEGHLNVIGGSGTPYLLHVEGVEDPQPATYDASVKITRDLDSGPAPAKNGRSSILPRGRPRPVGSIELIHAMRLGLRPEGGSILRGRGEVAFRTGEIEIRLLFVYKTASYVGRLYEVENLTSRRLAIDASRWRAAEGGQTLILSGLRENVLEPRGKTRLYTVFWREGR